MVSHIKSKIGSAQGSGGAGTGELAPLDPPVWEIVPDGSAQQGTLYEIDMNQWVEGRALTGWLLTGNPAGVTINSLGIVTLLDTVAAQILTMTCFVENEAGSDTSNSFDWELEAVHVPEPPVWIVVPPQETPENLLPDQLDMNDFVTSFLPITNWTTTEGSITAGGILVIPEGTPVGVLVITVTSENADGISASAPFNWEILEEGDAPVWIELADGYLNINDLPIQEDMNNSVTGDNLTGWALSGNPAGVTIDGVGVMTYADTLPPSRFTMTVYVENDFGNDTSNPFTILIADVPVIDTQPLPLVVVEPNGGEFTVVASHPDPGEVPLFYFWSHAFSDASGRDQPTYTLNSTDQIDDGETLSCRIRAYVDTPEFEITSDTVSLTANRTDPVIDTQPDNVETGVGENFSISVEASHPANAELFYNWVARPLIDPPGPWTDADEWFENGINHDTPEFTVTEVVESDEEAQIRCEVFAYTQAETTWRIFTDIRTVEIEPVSTPPDWHTPIPDQAFTDTQLPQSLDMDDFCNDVDVYTNSGDGDLVGSILTLPAGTNLGTAVSQVSATNEAGTTQSNSWNWVITGVLPVIDTQPSNLTVVEPAGGSFSASASHPTNAQLFYQWLEDFSNSSGATGTTLTLGSTEQSDDSKTAQLRVRAYQNTAEYEVLTSIAALTANRTDPTITLQPITQNIVEGESATFTVAAEHEAGAALFYIWDHDFAEIVGGIFNPTLNVINAVLGDDGKTCFCTVYAYAGASPQFEVSNSAALNIEADSGPPIWGTIPNNVGPVTDQPIVFDANNYVDSNGSEIIAWESGPNSSISAGGVVTINNLPSGSYPDQILATNARGTTQSNTYQTILASVVWLDDEFPYPNGILSGNGMWAPGASDSYRLVTQSARYPDTEARNASDDIPNFPGGDFELEIVPLNTYSHIDSILTDTVIVTIGLLPAPVILIVTGANTTASHGEGSASISSGGQHNQVITVRKEGIVGTLIKGGTTVNFDCQPTINGGGLNMAGFQLGTIIAQPRGVQRIKLTLL